MKKCDYCGYENDNNAVSCIDCGTSEFGPQTPTPGESEAPTPSQGSLKCDGCGVESFFTKGFREDKSSSKPKRFCLKCWTEKERRKQKKALGVQAGFLSLGVILVVSGIAPSHGWLILNILAIQVFLIPNAIWHETGHAVAGRLFGMRIFGITIGAGRALFMRRILGVPFEFKAFPYGGLTLAAPMTVDHYRVRKFLTVLAGPMANLILAAGAYWYLRQNGLRWNLMRGFAPVQVWFFSNALILAGSLVPLKANSVAGAVSNDALMLLELLFSKQPAEKPVFLYHLLLGLELCAEKKYEEARRWFEEAQAIYPNEHVLRLLAGSLLMESDEYQKARERLLPLLDIKDLEPELRFVAMNDIAYAGVRSGDRTLLSEADAFSEQALQYVPWSPSYKGTRGVVLVELGEMDAGIALLKEACEEDVGNSHKATNACHLAIAEERRGQTHEAKKYWQLARRWDPKCRLLAQQKDF